MQVYSDMLLKQRHAGIVWSGATQVCTSLRGMLLANANDGSHIPSKMLHAYDLFVVQVYFPSAGHN